LVSGGQSYILPSFYKTGGQANKMKKNSEGWWVGSGKFPVAKAINNSLVICLTTFYLWFLFFIHFTKNAWPRDKPSVPMLIKALKDQDIAVRRGALPSLE
jgi:hypothetical protein